METEMHTQEDICMEEPQAAAVNIKTKDTVPEDRPSTAPSHSEGAPPQATLLPELCGRCWGGTEACSHCKTDGANTPMQVEEHKKFDPKLRVQAFFTKEEMAQLKTKASEMKNRLVIGQIPGQAPSHPQLVNFLKAHIKDHFLSMQMLARGCFSIEFSDDLGASNCVKLTNLSWGGRVIRLGRWSQGFSTENPSSYKLGHVVRVQFPDLEPFLQDEHCLKWLGLLIGDVLSIEGKGTARKRPARPIVNVLVTDIKKLPATLCTPSFALGAKATEVKTQQMQRFRTSGFGMSPSQIQRTNH